MGQAESEREEHSFGDQGLPSICNGAGLRRYRHGPKGGMPGSAARCQPGIRPREDERDATLSQAGPQAQRSLAGLIGPRPRRRRWALRGGRTSTAARVADQGVVFLFDLNGGDGGTAVPHRR